MGRTTTDEAVVATVRAAMGEHQVSELGLSGSSGIPRETLRRRLSGATSFTVTELERIALALGKTPAEFFGETA
jgi:transcriptional regulator with XRE-family HTH domain